MIDVRRMKLTMLNSCFSNAGTGSSFLQKKTKFLELLKHFDLFEINFSHLSSNKVVRNKKKKHYEALKISKCFKKIEFQHFLQIVIVNT